MHVKCITYKFPILYSLQRNTSYVFWYLRPAVYSYWHRVLLNVLLTENPPEQISPMEPLFSSILHLDECKNAICEPGSRTWISIFVPSPRSNATLCDVASCSTTKHYSCFHRKHCQGVAESLAWRFARSNDRTRVCHDRNSERSALETWEQAGPESSTTAPTVPEILATTA